MPKFLSHLAASAVAITLAAAPAATAQEAGDVVATVNGQDITLGHLILARAQLPQQYQQLPDDVLFRGLLDQLVRQTLLSQALEEEPARLVIALDNERRSLRAGEIITEIGDEAVTEDAIQAAYEEQIASAEPELEYNARHILLETEERAAELKAEIDGGADFAEMAREHSTGPSGPRGGDLGWFSAGMMVPEFEEAVMALEPGQVGGPVQTQFGWHLIKLEETREQPKPTLDEVRGEIEGQLIEAAIDARIAELEEAATITRPEVGAFDPALLKSLDLLEPK